jgi:hypothetical protein
MFSPQVIYEGDIFKKIIKCHLPLNINKFDVYTKFIKCT